MVNYVVIFVANFAARTEEVQTLENLLDFSMHFFWRVSRQALGLDASPTDLSGDA